MEPPTLNTPAGPGNTKCRKDDLANSTTPRESSPNQGILSKSSLDNRQTPNTSPESTHGLSTAVRSSHCDMAANGLSGIPHRAEETPAQKREEIAVRKSAIAAAMEAVRYAAPGERERVINEAISATVNASSTASGTESAPQRPHKPPVT
jgi:hypothetical protein